MADPGTLIRLTGQAPVAATVYELEKLRCNLCGKIFTAEPPADAGAKRYDFAAVSMIAMLKYGMGFPFNSTDWISCKRTWRFPCLRRRSGKSSRPPRRVSSLSSRS